MKCTGFPHPCALRLLPDGRVLSDRTIQKIRAGVKGWRYAAQLLEEFGADECDYEGRAEWLSRWLPRLTRTMRHRGNYKYGWRISETIGRTERMTWSAYPKTLAA